MTAAAHLDEKSGSAEKVENCAIITTIDEIQVLGLSSEDASFYRSFSSERRRKVMRKAR